MDRPVAKGIGVIFFIGLLATPFLIRHLSAEEDGSSVSQETAMERYGMYFEEVADEVGASFTHHPPQFDEQLAHIMPQVASMGASVSVADFNRDGLQDFYVTNSRKGLENRLYRNDGDGTFTNVAPEMGVAAINTDETGVSMGSVWADYDNDGYEDLFVYKYGRPVLFHNDGGEGFSRVESIPLPDWVNANTATWFDYNRDGRVDLFLGGYYSEEFNLWDLSTTRIMPESFEYAHNGGRKYLYENLGEGRFEEVSEEVGIKSRRWALASSAADLNGDGYPELVIANDYGVDEIFLNQGGEAFTESGEQTGMGFTPKSGMNVAFGDVFNRGRFSVYVTNITEKGVLLQGNNLWVPRGEREEGSLKFANLAGDLGVEMGGWSYGAQFGDLNNDGLQDLFVANGYVTAEKSDSYWYDFSKITGANRSIIIDAENWPDMNDRSLSGQQTNRVWLNDGAGSFQEVAQAVGVQQGGDSRAVAVADLFGGGSLDVLVANQRGPLRIYRNHVPEGRHWIGFRLIGTESNRSAIGARVMLHWDDRRQVQMVDGGSGFASQNMRPVHFGLGSAAQVEKAVIQWPSGRTQTIEQPAVDSLHTVREPSNPPA